MSNILAPEVNDAIRTNNIEKIKELVQLGVRLEMSISGEKPPLYQAAKAGHADMIRLLIAHKAKVNERFHGKTPLYVAAYNNKLEAVKALIEIGANPTLDHLNKKSLMGAAYKGHVEIIRYLLILYNIDTHKPAINVNEGDEHNSTALYYAALKGHLEAVQILVEKGNADIKIRGFKNLSPIDVAQLKGHQQIVEYLKQREN